MREKDDENARIENLVELSWARSRKFKKKPAQKQNKPAQSFFPRACTTRDPLISAPSLIS